MQVQVRESIVAIIRGDGDGEDADIENGEGGMNSEENEDSRRGRRHQHGGRRAQQYRSGAEEDVDMDVVEQLRRESIDLRINPVAMRRVLFKLKSKYGKVHQAQKRELKRMAEDSSRTGPPVVLSPECPVCLVNFEPNDPVVPLMCNIDHVFHIECLLSWADHNYTCPICRQPIISNQSEINMYEVM